DLLAEADAAVVASRDVAAVIALDAAKAQLTYMEGSFGTTLGLLGHLEARMSAANDADEHARLVGLLLGDVLVAVDEFDAAERLIADGFSSAARERRLATSSAWQRLHGRWALQLGRVADAAAILDPVFNVEADDAVASVSDAATMAALGRIAMHLGDGRKARTFAKVAQAVTVSGAPELRRHATLLLALLASARRDVDAARCHLHALGSEGLDHALPMLMQDPSDHAHLVRLALDVGDIALARSATASAEACAAANPGVVSIAGTAAHARGLLHRDPSALADAVELLAAGHRPMAHASAAEDHGAELSRIGDQQGAIDALGAALRLYTFSGASWDASRVRSRLREHGVRRRIVKPARPTSGWAGLTDAEAAVVRRVVDGLTNREVAEQLYLSPHTVSMHLRHVFTKLHINSRVELARLAFEQEAAA
ncbi:MAG TPA: helix-turn-helix transcriptional regulator, partial [Actinomycetes bacterium]|nr:helix-turn-helix transcriptional regulator [Actinomycetes bacterium]